MAQGTETKNFVGSLYFAYTGCAIAVTLSVIFVSGLLKHSWDEVLTRALIVLLGITAAYAGVAFAQRFRRFVWLRIALNAKLIEAAGPGLRFARAYEWFVWLSSVIFVGFSLIMLFDAHRRYIGVVGLLEACAIYALRRTNAPSAMLAIGFVSVTTWTLSTGLTYTNLGDWILNSNVSPLAVLAFVGSFGLVLVELSDEGTERLGRSVPRYVVLVVIVIFALYAFRSDNLSSSWVPYHRSFAADVAQLVRDGHWLLWDIPSVYGFLSMAVVAVVPAKNAWQGLFIMTSMIIFIQSCIIFGLWRWGRNSWTNLVFAALLTLAIFGDGISRYPWSERLYPQGALRTIWILGLLGTAFLIYVWRERSRRVETLYWVGHAIWLVSLFWSFETAVWATAMWAPYLTLATLSQGFPRTIVRRLALRLWPIVVLPLAGASIIQLIYLRALGRGPDWFGYVEFTGLFVSGTIHAAFPTNPLGAGWCIVLTLGAVGSVAIASIRQGLWAVLPLLAATWLAVWTTSTYFTLEPFDGHVTLLLAVIVPAFAVVTFVSREVLRGDRTALYARLSIAPTAIVCIALFLGQPKSFADMKFPLQPGWTTDTVATLPPLSGELAALIARAGVHSGGSLLIPNGPYWTEISQGMLFPISHSVTTGNQEYHTWAPISPLGVEDTIMGLPAKRRQTYLERFLERSRSGGWYINYRAPAICENLSRKLVTLRTLHSANYSGSLCAFKVTS